MIFPPPPESELTVLVLEGRRVFESLYVSLASKHALSTLISAISIIQANGVSEWSFAMIKEGLPIRATTAPRTNSSVGYSFKIWETDP